MSNESPVTQRQLLEQNTAVTNLIYEKTAAIERRVSDGFQTIGERIGRLEGKSEGASERRSIALNAWWKTSIFGGLVFGLVGTLHSLIH